MLKDPINPAVVKITKIIQEQLQSCLGELLPGCSISKAAVHYNLAGQFRTEFLVQGKNGIYVVTVSQPYQDPPSYLADEEAPHDGAIVVAVGQIDP